LRYLDAGLLPLPTAYLGVTEPCDGIIGVHEALRTHPEWRNVPSFGIDVPYWSDDFSIDYVAGEIKRMVEFVSKHTGKTLDINRLREVITESNEHYRLWQEYNDLRRCKPSPHNYLLPQSCFLMTNFEGRGARSTRRGSGTWWPTPSGGCGRTSRGAEPENPGALVRPAADLLQPDRAVDGAGVGVSVVMDMVSYCPYTLIDTSPRTACSGAWPSVSPWTRDDPPGPGAGGQLPGRHQPHRAGLPDRLRDLAWAYRPQGRAASVSLMRELCRELNVPFLQIGMDQFDKRYTSPDLIKERISHFFTATGLGEKTPV